jgi:hypothetical protein
MNVLSRIIYANQVEHARTPLEDSNVPAGEVSYLMILEQDVSVRILLWCPYQVRIHIFGFTLHFLLFFLCFFY